MGGGFDGAHATQWLISCAKPTQPEASGCDWHLGAELAIDFVDAVVLRTWRCSACAPTPLLGTPRLHAACSCSRLSSCWSPHSPKAAVVVEVRRPVPVTP